MIESLNNKVIFGKIQLLLKKNKTFLHIEGILD